ncbi:MAG: type II secretion system F family protein [Planctomycetes bacterium]|nr:type II secretion system F family protein [Planctomycetota bacterium]
MPTFTYKAKKSSGEIVRGSLTAENERTALAALDRMQVFPIEVKSSDNGNGAEPAPSVMTQSGRLNLKAIPAVLKSRSRKVRADDLSLFLRQLADLLKAGIPLNRALQTLTRQTTNPAFAEMIADIRTSVSGGSSLATAFAAFPESFTPLHVGMVKAGEAGGFLEEALARCALFTEKEQELRNRVSAAMAYPALLLVLGVAAVVYLLTFFIPRLTPIFSDLGGALPLITRVLITTSNFFAAYWVIIVGAMAAAVLVSARALRTPAGKAWLDRFLSRAPVVGPIFLKTAIARFGRMLGTLLKNGVPMLQALEITRDAVGNLLVGEEIDRARGAVREGAGLAEPLRTGGVFPPVVVDMLAVGDESGNLDEVLLSLADTYDTQVDRAVKVFISLLEPAMILVMAAIVGFIVIAMLLPIFSLNAMVH